MYKDYEIKLNAILDKHKGVQKVDLALTDDIDKLFNLANENAKGFVQTRKKLSDIAADKNKAVNKLNKKAETLRKTFESAAKELGIDVKTSKPYKKIEATIKTLSSIQNAFARMSAKINQEKP